MSIEKISVSQSFDQLWLQIKNHIQIVADKFDSRWRKRYRTIGTEFLIAFIFKLVLSKNTQGYGSILNELWEQFEKNDIRKVQARPFSQSSVCEAKQKLSANVFLDLNKRIIDEWEDTQGQNILYKGHRIFGIDGSKINLPPILTNYGYTTPSKTSFYPQGLLSCLYELQSGISYDFELASHHNERTCALDHLKVLRPTDIVIFDRGYFSFFVLKKYMDKGAFTIFRLQRGSASKEILDFWQSSELEKEMLYKPSRETKLDIMKIDPNVNFDPIPVRLIKYTIENETYVLLTTLLGPEYPRELFLDLYHGRWASEENYKISKCSIEVEDFHAKSDLGVKQELYAHFCLMNLSRILEHKCIINKNPDTSLLAKHTDSFYSVFNKLGSDIKFNFKNNLLVLTRAIEELVFYSPQKFVSDQLPIMIISIQNLYQKLRPYRHFPRISRKPVNKWRNNNNKVKLSTA